MKTFVSPRSNLTCRLVRGWISVRGEASAGHRGLGSTHVAHCADCQHFFAAGDELEVALKRDAARSGFDTPAGLEQRILHAVHQSARPARKRSSSWGALSLVGVAACVALAVLFKPRVPSPDHGLQTTGTEISASEVTGGEDSISSRLWNSITPPVGDLLEKNSLQAEVDFVYADARSAIHFLSLNFLPSPSDASSESGARRRAVDG